MALSDTAIKAAKPGAAHYKLHDDGGLFLIVRQSGGKLWRLKFRYNGKEQQLSIGRYPDVSLKDARERRDNARKIIASGKNPAAEKKREAVAAAISAANTFKAVADEVIAKGRHEGRATATLAKAEWAPS